MLSNRVEFFFPQFKNIIFITDSFMLNQILFSNKYTFFFLINSVYDFFFFKLLKKFNYFFLKTFSFHWIRVSFKGKGYRLRKFKNKFKITFNFGHSHWSKIITSDNYFFKKIKRQNYICLIKFYQLTKVFKMYIKKIKKLNSYTKRGLRLKKQYIRKRFGKISQVVSSLH